MSLGSVGRGLAAGEMPDPATDNDQTTAARRPGIGAVGYERIPEPGGFTGGL